MPKKRRTGQEKLKPRLHIFCEGEKTEPNYLKGYIERRFPGTRLSPVRHTPKNTPIQLVEEAIREKEKNPSGDIFWVVYDREAATKYPDRGLEPKNDCGGCGMEETISMEPLYGCL